jgi:hypothetical protein
MEITKLLLLEDYDILTICDLICGLVWADSGVQAERISFGPLIM